MPNGKRMRDSREVEVDNTNSDSILIIATIHGLLILDLNGKQCGLNKHSKTPPKEAVVLKIIIFYRDGFPERMGALRLGDRRFFMFGGIAYFKKRSRRGRGKYGNSRSRENLKTVYKLNPYNGWSLELTNEVNQPSGPKVSPIVHESNGKIFVFQHPMLTFGTDNPQPLFEFYDTNLNLWKKIPSDKSWSMDERAIMKIARIDIDFVVGCKIYIVLMDAMDQRWLFCFNTNTFKWEKESALNMWNSLQVCPHIFDDTSFTVCGIDNLGDNLNIIINKDPEESILSAYLIDDSGSIACYQELNCDLYYELDICIQDVALVNHKSGGGRICLIIRVRDSVWGNQEDWDVEDFTIIIRHFQLKLIHGFEDEIEKLSPGPVKKKTFLTIERYGDQQSCRLYGVQSGSTIDIRDAYFF